MIARLHGRVVGRRKDSLIVETGGIGLQVTVPAPLATSAQTGEEIQLYTHLHLRESEIALYGLASEEELTLFQQLITVQGIGPRSAIGILGGMAPDALRLAISQDQPSLLARVPGIGPKTAKKIVMELKDKVGVAGISEELVSLSNVDAEVVDALTALGYSIVEAQRAVQSVPRSVTDMEERLRQALASFSS